MSNITTLSQAHTEYDKLLSSLPDDVRNLLSQYRVTPFFKNEFINEFIDDSLTLDTPGVKVYNVLDTETTGLNEGDNELFMLTNYNILVSSDYRKIKINSKNTYYNRPKIPIPQKYQDAAKVSDETIDSNQITKEMLDDLLITLSTGSVIAHNAPFDRWFVRKLGQTIHNNSDLDITHDLSWSCSNREVNWRYYGYKGTSLYNIIDSLNISISDNWHNAESDVISLIYVLIHPLIDTSQFKVDNQGIDIHPPVNGFEIIDRENHSTELDIIVHNSPFSAKDKIKSYKLDNRYFRWNSELKSWIIRVRMNQAPQVLQFLNSDIYTNQTSKPIINKVSRSDRYR